MGARGRNAAAVLAAALVSGGVGSGQGVSIPWPEMEKSFAPPPEFKGKLGDYRSLMEFDDGTPVKTRQDWSRRREEIRTYWHRVMGEWPRVIEKPRVKVIEKVHVENFTRHKVQVEFAPDRFAGDQYLLVPDGRGPFPAVLATWYNSEDSAGLTEKARGTVDFGVQLAKRGFVALCIGGVSPEEAPPAEGKRGIQPLSYMAYAAANCCNALANLPEVDPKRIAVLGHSFGGKWAMFASCLYDRFACAVWVDPGIVWNEKDPNANYWEKWYLGYQFDQPPDGQRKPGIPKEGHPRTGAYATLVAQGRDMHELHALMAPRPFLVSGGAQDRPRHWTALNHTIALNDFLGQPGRVAMTMRDGHTPTPESNAQAYTFLEHFLGKVGRALRFSSKGSIRLDGQAARLPRLTDFTISMWIQYDGGPSRILYSFSDGTLSHRIQVEVHQDALGFGWQDGGSFQNFTTRPLSWERGRWYHVVFVNDVGAGKSILRSNDLVWKTDPNTLSPATLRSPVTSVEIGSLCGAYSFNGRVDDVRLYDSALSLPEQLALYEENGPTPDDPEWRAAARALIERGRRAAVGRRARDLFYAEEAPRLSPWELELKADWLFQAEQDDLLARAEKEIAWTRAMIDRLRGRDEAPCLSAESAELMRIERRASAADASLDASEMRSLYFEIRALKRRVMFKSPEIDFSDIICVDAPYTRRSPDTHGTFHQSEWVHESRFRSEMCASHGAKLVVLEDIANTPAPRALAPKDDFGRRVAMFGFDVAFDGDRVLFCMKPEDEKAYHLYEIGIDGGGFRQITSGGYSDIDPIYLPGSGYLFLSTRAEVYAQCGMWARSYILTRCDADGRNTYILSPGTEPDYSPSLLDDGRILYTRWEYIDKFANRIQSLWTVHPDGTAAAAFWGNQSEIPDHLGEARQIPGTPEVLFTGFGHHDVWMGCIGVLDSRKGLNFPAGIGKVTQEIPWPEVGDSPVSTPGLTEEYHTSGPYAAYKTPYPLSRDLFLVSARTGAPGNAVMQSAHDPTIGKFKLYLMDIYGNRELVHEGENNVLYAQPLRPRPRPPVLPDLADLPGSERDHPVVRPGVLFSNDIFESAPAAVREHARYLRIIESMPKNYSVGIVHSGGKPFGADGVNPAWGNWGKAFLRGKVPMPTTDVTWGDQAVFCGPATTISGPLGVKRVHGTVPIRRDGSVRFEVPPCRMLYFQVLDAQYRAVHTMRSWVSVRPGEIRGCTGCHEGHTRAPVVPSAMARMAPDAIQPPPWGVRSLSYVKDIQPIFDRACARCHQGDGEAVRALDLTLRPDERGESRWGGIFPEPYLTLLMGRENDRVDGACPGFRETGGYVAVPNTIVTRYDTLPPLTYLSPKAKLIDQAMDRDRCGKHLRPEDLRMLIAWVDLWAMYRSDEECRSIEDPPGDWFPLWTYPPKTETAPRVRTEYSQDEFTCPEDRVYGRRHP